MPENVTESAGWLPAPSLSRNLAAGLNIRSVAAEGSAPAGIPDHVVRAVFPSGSSRSGIPAHTESPVVDLAAILDDAEEEL